MKQTLIDIKALIQDPAHWTQGAYARTKNGNIIGPCEPNACQWCIDGAVHKINRNGHYDAYSLLSASSRELYGVNYVEVNDNIGHEAVLKILDHAIELAQ